MNQFFSKIVLILLLAVCTQKTNAQTDHKNLNPFKQKTVSPAKVAIATWNSAAAKAAKGDESEWKTLVSCSYVDYATLVYENLAAGDNTIVKTDINYMLSHASLAIRHIKKGDKIWGIKADGTLDYYLALSDFDCDVLVYKTKDAAGTTIEIDIAVWDCFNPKVYVRTETKADVVTVTKHGTTYVVQTVEKPVYYKEVAQQAGYQAYYQPTGMYMPVQQPVYYPQGYIMLPLPQCFPLFRCQPAYTCWSGGQQCGMYPRTQQNANITVNVSTTVIVNNTNNNTNTNNNVVTVDKPRPGPTRPTGTITGGTGDGGTITGGTGTGDGGTITGGVGTGTGDGGTITGADGLASNQTNGTGTSGTITGSGKKENDNTAASSFGNTTAISAAKPATRINTTPAVANTNNTTANIGNTTREVKTASQDNQFYTRSAEQRFEQPRQNSTAPPQLSNVEANRMQVRQTNPNRISTAPPQLYNREVAQRNDQVRYGQPQQVDNRSFGQQRAPQQPNNNRANYEPQRVQPQQNMDRNYGQRDVRQNVQQQPRQQSQQQVRGQQYSQNYNQQRVQPQQQMQRVAPQQQSRPMQQNMGMPRGGNGGRRG